MLGRRNIIQDIIRTRSNSSHRGRAPEAVDPDRASVSRGRGGDVQKWSIRIFILIVILAGGFWVTSAFGRVEVRVTPQSRIVSLDRSFVARQIGEAGIVPTAEYDIIKVSQRAELPVAATGQEFVERKARGVITVYNNHSVKSERLIGRTRFEAPGGNIYRIEKAISIPGITAGEPGTLEVEVVADALGESYNLSGDVKFTIPGLAGDDRFEDIYAALKTNIEGGYSGIQNSASESDLLTAERNVRELASENLSGALTEQIPKNYILFDDAVLIDFERESGDASGGTGDDYVVAGTATAYGVVFDRQMLSTHIANAKEAGIQVKNNDEVLIENLDSIEFNFLNKEAFMPKEGGQVIFSISGPLRFVWQFDEEGLITRLLGLKKTEFQQVFLSYSSIAAAESSVVPSLRRYFPDEREKIEIIRVFGEE
ncbi:MAG: hypothetical protein Q8Q18_01945 [bacterium]|nr:hypothetical protein [bacterium]